MFAATFSVLGLFVALTVIYERILDRLFNTSKIQSHEPSPDCDEP